MRIDERIEKQVLYHLISIATDKTRYAELIDFANESHLVSERYLLKLEAKNAETDNTVSSEKAETDSKHDGRSLRDAPAEPSSSCNAES